MRIKIIMLFGLVIILQNQITSQTLKIDYHKIDFREYDGGKNTINPTELYLSAKESYFLEDQVIDGRTTNVPIDAYNKGNYLGAKIAGDSKGKIIIKDLTKNQFLQRKNSVNHKEFPYRKVTDSILPKFDWKLINENKTILGYSAQKAETTHNDRKITAWFSSQLAFSDGPWKFHGLPGLILEVKIEFEPMQYMVYEAIKISPTAAFPQIPEITDPEEQLSQIEREYYNKAKNNFKYFRTISKGQLKLRLDDLDFKPILFETN
ncbi:MAG: GLPGLI family protein [Flavobacteriaceae bacterium]